MKRKPYSAKAINRYVEENLESSALVNYLDFYDPELESHFYDELNGIDVKGYPFSSDIVNEKGEVFTFDTFDALPEEKKKGCRLRYHYLPRYHELYIGTTGSGKTTGCIEPQIRAISSQKNKPNLFITDPKGELFERHATHLKKQGYKVFILNFKNTTRSYCWNPLMEIYEKQHKILDLGKGAELVQGIPAPDQKVFDHRDKFKGTYYLYKGIAFANAASLDQYVTSEAYIIKSHVSSLINQIACSIIPPNKANDPTWTFGARDFLKGIILCMAEESTNKPEEFTSKMMTLKTVSDIYAMFVAALEKQYSSEEDKKDAFLADKSSIAYNLLSTVLETAPVTRKGFLSTFNAAVGPWMQGHIFQLTAETNIDLNIDTPFAAFIATRDYDKSDNTIAGLFIDWVYRHCLEEAEQKISEGKPTRPIHFLLDEFANIPAIPDFENKIATSRSRDIWFHLFIQSYDQLDLVYGKETAGVICDNCNEQVFLGSQSFATKKKFSDECGKKAIKDVNSAAFNSKANVALIEVPVVSVSDLDLIQTGEMYIKRIYSDVIKGGYIRSYQGANAGLYLDMYNTSPYEDVPYNVIIPDGDDYTYYPAAPTWYKKSEDEIATGSEKQTEDPVVQIDLDELVKKYKK